MDRPVNASAFESFKEFILQSSSTMSRKVIVNPTLSVSHVPRQTFAGGALKGLWVVVVAALAYYALFRVAVLVSAAAATVVGIIRLRVQ